MIIAQSFLRYCDWLRHGGGRRFLLRYLRCCWCHVKLGGRDEDAIEVTICPFLLVRGGFQLGIQGACLLFVLVALHKRVLLDDKTRRIPAYAHRLLHLDSLSRLAVYVDESVIFALRL